jgi:hypothetical protein
MPLTVVDISIQFFKYKLLTYRCYDNDSKDIDSEYIDSEDTDSVFFKDIDSVFFKDIDSAMTLSVFLTDIYRGRELLTCLSQCSHMALETLERR